ncbi:DUF309 domain-containing protein [Oceanithermus desulfurans]|uniref:DUF309 domain-containing protein n=2 Tax=Oceanithermus desulfurans TaxID=227924 RepID=A0A511RMM3_9DEIN|nr:DUF309 domain-containing protein [Oceanithermus desulfurans]MBB6030724.1 hypothetical protein [Oceanithermus desulfurans]GEM90347.1 hypothetical protein ODE01S_17810 [Oceanithermus desulfurans NBRC 100063]
MRQPNREALDRAARLWQEGAFWEVHEALEPAWMASRGEERLLLHGLIQLAAALEARRRGRARGARANLAKARAKWAALGFRYHGRDLRPFLEGCARALEGAPVPAWPWED